MSDCCWPAPAPAGVALTAAACSNYPFGHDGVGGKFRVATISLPPGLHSPQDASDVVLSTGADLVADVETAIRWVKGHATEYRLDLSRTALLGESAGGHLVSLVGTRMEQEGTTKLPAVVSCDPQSLTHLVHSDQALILK